MHRTDDTLVASRAAANCRRHSRCTIVEIPGTDHLAFLDAAGDRRLAEMEEFLTGSRSAAEVDRVLATVVFEDIVDSTRRAGANGDRAWRDLLDAHDKRCAGSFALPRKGGSPWATAFWLPSMVRRGRSTAPARSTTRCIGSTFRRIGVHTGEVELAENDVRGIAVHIASRVAHIGGADDVLVSRTVKDLVAGSGIKFEDFGMHTLKGIPEEWQLFRALG